MARQQSLSCSQRPWSCSACTLRGGLKLLAVSPPCELLFNLLVCGANICLFECFDCYLEFSQNAVSSTENQLIIFDKSFAMQSWAWIPFRNMEPESFQSVDNLLFCLCNLASPTNAKQRFPRSQPPPCPPWWCGQPTLNVLSFIILLNHPVLFLCSGIPVRVLNHPVRKHVQLFCYGSFSLSAIQTLFILQCRCLNACYSSLLIRITFGGRGGFIYHRCDWRPASPETYPVWGAVQRKGQQRATEWGLLGALVYLWQVWITNSVSAPFVKVGPGPCMYCLITLCLSQIFMRE
jgi:hypothetical protein